MKTLYLDNSTMKAVATCSTYDAIRYILGFTTQQEKAALKAGTAVHEAMAMWLRTGGNVEAALAALATSYREWSEANVPPTDRLGFDNVETVISSVLVQRPFATLPFTVHPSLIEVGAQAQLTPDGVCLCGHMLAGHNGGTGCCELNECQCPEACIVIFVGRLDAAVIGRDGGWRVLDWKAQPLDASILTPAGFVPMSLLQVGSTILGADGRPCTVTGIHPQGELMTYRVRLSDGGEALCSGGHLWTVTDDHRRTRTLTLDQIMATSTPSKFRLPALAPVEFAPTGPAPLDGYLLGALLGNGHLAGHSVLFSTGSLEQAELVRAALPPGDTIKKCPSQNYSWAITGGETLNAIRSLGLAGTLSWSKFIPNRYKYGTVEERLAVLQGLLDTDGCIYDGYVMYDTTSEQLGLDVVGLVRSLGGVARIRKATNPNTKHQLYRAAIRISRFAPFRLTRKQEKVRSLTRPETRIIAAIEPVGMMPMQCISTSALSGLYVTDDYLVTHNSTGQMTAMWLEQFQTDSQQDGYTWLLEQHLGQPVVGSVIGAIELAKVPSDPVRKCAKHGKVPYAECGPLHVKHELLETVRAPEQLAEWRKTALSLARKHRELTALVGSLDDLYRVRMTGKFTGACARCEFNPFCRSHRDRDIADALLHYEPWVPFERITTAQPAAASAA